MQDINAWMKALEKKLVAAFAGRLLFLGLQGSRARGEAGPDSDIDVVCILDALNSDDLDAYGAAVRSMPEGEKACGFISGRQELAVWPAYDLLTLALDTRPFRGEWESLISLPTGAAARQTVYFGAANLYHSLCHNRLYEPLTTASIHTSAKSAFFLLRAAWYLETGAWPPTARALYAALDAAAQSAAREVLALYLWPEKTSDPAEAFQLLFGWCKALLLYYGHPSADV